MFPHHRSLLLVAVCSLLLSTIAGLALAPSASADTEGWPWFPQPSEPSTAKTIPLDSPLCVDRDDNVYLNSNGRCARGLTTIHFSPQQPVAVCAAPLDWFWLRDEWS